MASVNWAGFTFIDPFNPGESRVVTFADVNSFFWLGKAFCFLVQAREQISFDRAIEVTRVVHRAEGRGPFLHELVDITFKNVGVDPIPFYNINLGIISE